MSLRTSLNSLRMRGLFQLLRPRSNPATGQPIVRSVVGFSRNREMEGFGWRLVSTGVGNGSRKIEVESTSSSPPSPAASAPVPARPASAPKPGFPRWARWLLGSVLSLVLSFWMPNAKWGTLLRIGGEADIVMQEVEKAAEAVEKVATMAEKVSADIAQQLPDDAKFKAAALIAEHVSEEAVNDARFVEQIIHKVDEVKQDVEDIGKMAEPIIDKIIHENQKANNKL